MRRGSRLPYRPAFSFKDASGCGVPKASLHRLRGSGLLEQIGPSLYLAADNLDADVNMIAAARRTATRPGDTPCLRHSLPCCAADRTG